MEWLAFGSMSLAALLPIYVLIARARAVGAWQRSAPGMLHAEALGSWLLAKARIESAAPTPEPAVFRIAYEGRMVGRRSHRVFIKEERCPVRMAVQILPIGGGEVRTEGVVTIPAAELDQLAPGTIFSVLYDPRDPRRFYVDTMHRDRILIDAVTMRTRQTEENYRAQLAFSPIAAQHYRG